MPGAGIVQAALRFILCWAGSVAIGFAVFGGAIFHPDKAVYQFVVAGAISGASIAASPGLCSIRMLAVFIGGYLAAIAITGSTSPVRYSTIAMMVISVILSVQVGLRWDKVFTRIALGKFVLWAAGFGLIRCVAVGLLSVVLGTAIDFHDIVQAATTSILIGAGIGFGYELSEIASRKLFGDRLREAQKAA